ncbi:MAG: hypothetical protein RKE49_11820 [Oceanicaulis sp.]
MSAVEDLLETLIAEIQGLREDVRDLKGSAGYDLSDVVSGLTDTTSALGDIKFEVETHLGTGPLGIAQQITGPTGYNLEDVHNALISLEVAIDTK